MSRRDSVKGPSARVALRWAVLGVAVFGGGIVSCRQASSDAAVARKMLAYEQRPATLLRTRYTPATNRISALVRLPEASNDVPIRVALTPEQHALLHARLTRLQPQNRQVLVEYFPPMPEQVLLIDAALQRLFATGEDTSPVISYNTLGLILCSVGAVLVGMYLTKYFNLTQA